MVLWPLLYVSCAHVSSIHAIVVASRMMIIIALSFLNIYLSGGGGWFYILRLVLGRSWPPWSCSSQTGRIPV